MHQLVLKHYNYNLVMDYLYKNYDFTVADPGFPVGGGGGGAALRRVHFLAKTYAKTKIDPVRLGRSAAPPGSANDFILF